MATMGLGSALCEESQRFFGDFVADLFRQIVGAVHGMPANVARGAAATRAPRSCANT
jgi:hypothetical protein